MNFIFPEHSEDTDGIDGSRLERIKEAVDKVDEVRKECLV